jgi:hypothetical protein
MQDSILISSKLLIAENESGCSCPYAKDRSHCLRWDITECLAKVPGDKVQWLATLVVFVVYEPQKLHRPFSSSPHTPSLPRNHLYGFQAHLSWLVRPLWQNVT